MDIMKRVRVQIVVRLLYDKRDIAELTEKKTSLLEYW